MTSRLVAGVYIERHQGTILRALAESSQDKDGRPYERLSIVGHGQVPWDSRKAADGLKQLAFLVTNSGKDLVSVGIASYGPFMSLDPLRKNYGVIDLERSQEALAGKDLATLFRDALARARGDAAGRIVIHTDANACALGEAVTRGLSRHHVLSSLLVTEGIGAGFVTGQTIPPSALHPEIGLLPLRFHNDDPLKPETFGQAYSRSAGDLAGNSAMRLRASRMYQDYSGEDIRTISYETFWQFRAYYISQLCVAMTAILAPHSIVVLGDIEPRSGHLVKQTSREFRGFFRQFEREKNPVFSYPELSEPTFISGPSVIPGVPSSPSIAASGVWGMAYAAALKSRAYLART